MAVRSSWQVALSVWHALFIREVLARTTMNRFAPFWILAEPVLDVYIMIGLRALLGRMKLISGADYVSWLLVGLMGFFLFRDGFSRSVGAIPANKGLFAYRQVKPIDPVLARCFVEGVLKTIAFLILIVGSALLGFNIFPDDPLAAIGGWVSLWLLGLGSGLILSASTFSDTDKIVRLTMFPLFLFSGALFPLNFLPHEVLTIAMYNPVVHGLEFLRSSFFHNYHGLNGINMQYFYYWVLVMVMLGLMLHVRFAQRLRAQ